MSRAGLAEIKRNVVRDSPLNFAVDVATVSRSFDSWKLAADEITELSSDDKFMLEMHKTV